MSEIEITMQYIAEEKAREEVIKEDIQRLERELEMCINKQIRYQNLINALLQK